ncbi:MAG TPA: protoporphyrinogen oxidase [Terracidiphilus sp.]|jgi:oxygen-dependent protoporphyrinogen oxidase
MRTAIIGGGIAGLAAAYELENARLADPTVRYTLFETRERLGGAIASEVVEGTVLERGPDSFLTEKQAGSGLCRELGLGADLIPSNDAARKTWILVKNELVALPDGLMFLVPTKLVPTALTPLFSMSTKARMALELLIPPRRKREEDESVASLVSRHFGPEAVDRLADPLLSGIYGGDAAQLSAKTVLPRLVEMETQYGSLTRGMLAAHRKMRARAAANGNGPQAGGNPERAVFTSLRGGMQQMVDAIKGRLDWAAVRLSTPVNALEKTIDGWMVHSLGTAEFYDSVIVASPAYAAGVLLAPVDSTLSEQLGEIPYSSSITVNLVYDEDALGRLPEGFGFLVPASERRSLLACTFAHRKFLGRTAPGKAVIRAFLGGMRNEALLAENDNALVAIVRHELIDILGESVVGIGLDPEYTQVTRWRRSMAQYAVGHQARIARINERVAALPGLRLAGNAYDGIGVPDCIRLGRKAASDLIQTAAGQRV